MPIQSGLFKSINRAFPYLGRGCIVTLAVVSIITAELSVSTTWSAAFIIDNRNYGDLSVLPSHGGK
jgi:hypothetical protein